MNRPLVAPLLALLLASCVTPPPQASKPPGSSQVAPKAADTYVKDAEALLKASKPALALEAIDKAIELCPKAADLRARRGNVLQELKRLPEALDSFNKAIALNPLDCDLHCVQANCLIEMERREEAAESFTRAMELAPYDPAILVQQGYNLNELGRYAEAIVVLRNACRLSPKLSWPHYLLGDSLLEQQKYDEALPYFDKAIEIEPESDFYFKSRGTLRRLLGDLNGAAADLEKALALDPNYKSVMLNLSWAYEELGRIADAQRLMDAYLAASKQGAFEIYQKAMQTLRLGDQEQALTLLKKACAGELTPSERLSVTLCRYLLEARLGKQADPQPLLASLAAYSPKEWDQAVVKFVLGKVSLEELFARVAEATNPATRESQLCDAFYYDGQLKFIAGDRQAGLSRMRECLSSGALLSMERRLACAELKLTYPALEYVPKAKRGVPTKGDNLWERRPGREWDASLRMIAAHAALRTPEVNDPDSPSNRKVLEALLRKALLGPVSSLETRVPATQPAANSIVGTLPGHFSIDSSGVASYTITLPIPPGRNGLNPGLSLWYSSDSGSGQLGTGFGYSTSFTKVIERGRSLLARDGVAQSRKLDRTDALYFGGKRLLCLDEGDIAGLPGSHYRTEVESFMLFTALGEGKRLTGFKVIDRKGWTYHYGKYVGETDGFQTEWDEDTQAPSPEASTFALKRVEDDQGNWIHYSYRQGGPGEWALSKIRYAGGRDISPGFEINFNYRSRLEGSFSYESGYRSDRTLLLDCIDVFALERDTPTTRVAQFSLDYTKVLADTKRLINAIGGELRAELTQAPRPLEPTRFYWSPEQTPTRLSGITIPTKEASLDAEGENWLVADVNNDGKPDLIDGREGLVVHVSTPAGIPDQGSPWLGEESLLKHGFGKGTRFMYVCDLNGDLASDLLLFDGQSRLTTILSKGDHFEIQKPRDIGAFLGTGAGTLQASADLPTRRNLASRIAPMEGLGLSAHFIRIHGFNGTTSRLRLQGDELVPERLPLVSEVKRATQPDKDLPGESKPCEEPLWTYIADFNGDGLDDQLWVESREGEKAEILLASFSLPGGGMTTPVKIDTWKATRSPAKPALPARGIYVAALNADSYPDLLLQDTSGNAREAGTWKVFLMKGTHSTQIQGGVSPVREVESPLPAAFLLEDGRTLQLGPDSAAHLQFLDLDLNGRDDLVWYGAAANKDTTVTTHSWWIAKGLGGASFARPEPLVGPLWEELSPLAGQSAATQSRKTILLSPIKDPQGRGQQCLLVKQRDANMQTRMLGISRYLPQGTQCAFPNLVTDFVNGLGQGQSIGYKAGNDESITGPGAATESPVPAFHSASPVVSDIWKKSDGPAPSQFSYVYAGRRIDYSGRGGLGFTSICTLDRGTHIIKHQFMEGSFPITGLPIRDTYYAMVAETPDALGIHETKRTNYINSYDAVRFPDSHTPTGSLSTHVEIENRDVSPYDLSVHFWLPKTGTASFLPAKFPESHGYLLKRRKVLDRRSPRQMGAVLRPEPMEVQWLATKLPHDPLPEKAGCQFPALVWLGNEFVTMEVTANEPSVLTYAEAECTTWPVRRERSLVKTSQDSPNVFSSSSITRKRHWEGTGLFDTITVESHENEETRRSETRYIRDAKGRLLQQLDRTGSPAANQSPEIVYQASGYSNDLDLPSSVLSEESQIGATRYNPLNNSATALTYVSGEMVLIEKDELGNISRVANPAGKYLKTVELAWTRPGETGWKSVQTISAPAGLGQAGTQSKYGRKTRITNQATVIEYFDAGGRRLRTVTEQANGEQQVRDFHHNALDQEEAFTNVYSPGSPPHWIIRKFDFYGNELK